MNSPNVIHYKPDLHIIPFSFLSLNEQIATFPKTARIMYPTINKKTGGIKYMTLCIRITGRFFI